MWCKPFHFFRTSEFSSSVPLSPASVPARCTTSSITCFNERFPLHLVVYHVLGLYLLKNQLKQTLYLRKEHCHEPLESKVSAAGIWYLERAPDYHHQSQTPLVPSQHTTSPLHHQRLLATSLLSTNSPFQRARKTWKALQPKGNISAITMPAIVTAEQIFQPRISKSMMQRVWHHDLCPEPEI